MITSFAYSVTMGSSVKFGQQQGGVPPRQSLPCIRLAGHLAATAMVLLVLLPAQGLTQEVTGKTNTVNMTIPPDWSTDNGVVTQTEVGTEFAPSATQTTYTDMVNGSEAMKATSDVYGTSEGDGTISTMEVNMYSSEQTGITDSTDMAMSENVSDYTSEMMGSTDATESITSGKFSDYSSEMMGNTEATESITSGKVSDYSSEMMGGTDATESITSGKVSDYSTEMRRSTDAIESITSGKVSDYSSEMMGSTGAIESITSGKVMATESATEFLTGFTEQPSQESTFESLISSTEPSETDTPGIIPEETTTLAENTTEVWGSEAYTTATGIVPPEMTTTLPEQEMANTSESYDDTTTMKNISLSMTTIEAGGSQTTSTEHILEETTTGKPSFMDAIYKLEFLGDCKVLSADEDVKALFKERLKNAIREKLGLPSSRKIDFSIECGSVLVTMTIANVSLADDFDGRLERFMNDKNFTIMVEGVNTNGSYEFTPLGFQVVMSPAKPSTAPDTTTTIWKKEKSSGLTNKEKVLVVVLCCVVGTSCVVLVAALCYACFNSRRLVKTYHLGNTPRHGSEDFTIIELDPPQPAQQANNERDPAYSPPVETSVSPYSPHDPQQGTMYHPLQTGPEQGDRSVARGPHDMDTLQLPSRIASTPLPLNEDDLNSKKKPNNSGATGFENPSYSNDDTELPPYDSVPVSFTPNPKGSPIPESAPHSERPRQQSDVESPSADNQAGLLNSTSDPAGDKVPDVSEHSP